MSSLMELLKNKKAALSANRRAKTVKPEDGRSRWRVLPGWRKAGAENAEQFWHDFGAHFIKDAAGELKAIYVCVDKTYGKPCAICSTINQAVKATADEGTQELLKESRSTGRVLLNALRIDGEAPTEPVLLEVPPSVFEGMINIINEWGVDTISLGAEGKDFVIERSGKGKMTKYSVQIGAKSEPVPAGVMSKITNLDEYVAQESEEQAVRALTSFRQVAGLLPSGVSAGVSSGAVAAKPAMSSMMIDEDDAALAALEGSASVVTAPAAAAEVDEDAAALAALQAKMAAKAEAKLAAVATPAVAAPAAAATGDSELDALLAQLG